MDVRKGESLIEVVIAIGVLGIVTAAFTTYFTWSFGLLNYTNARATEESIARSQLEYIKQQVWNDSGIYSTLATPSHYTVTSSSANVSGATGVQLITINVSRTFSSAPGKENTQTVTLQGYKGNR